MDRWTLVLLCSLLLGGVASAGRNRTLQESQGTGKSKQSGEYRIETRYRWHADEAEEGSRRARAKCLDIPPTMNLCRGIGYLKMRLPNLLGHETLAEAQHEAASWTPLLSTRCSANTQLFLCSLFSPVCLDQPIWPCRSLCLEVKRGCEARMASHGYPWPEMLDCEKLPTDNDLCIGIQANRSSAQDSDGQTSCKACQNITSGIETMIGGFCQAEFVAKIKPEMAVISGNDLKIMPAKKIKFYKEPAATVPHKRRQTFYILDGTKCECFDFSSTAQYIVMGYVTDKQRMALTSVVKYDVGSKAGRQALRTMKNPNGCPSTGTQRPAISPAKGGKVRRIQKLGRKGNERKYSNVESLKSRNKGPKKKKVPTATLR